MPLATMTALPHSPFAERLRMLRLRSKLTQEQLAAKLGCSQNLVGMWERGESSPDVPMLLGLAKLLGASTSFLVGESPSESGLPSGYFLIDVDKVEGARVPGDDWAWLVPSRVRIADYQEVRRIQREHIARKERRKR